MEEIESTPNESCIVCESPSKLVLCDECQKLPRKERPTDKERMLATFDAIGLKYEVEPRRPDEEGPQRLVNQAYCGSKKRFEATGYDPDAIVAEIVYIDQGLYYDRMWTAFYFDAGGKFVGHICAE